VSLQWNNGSLQNMSNNDYQILEEVLANASDMMVITFGFGAASESVRHLHLLAPQVFHLLLLHKGECVALPDALGLCCCPRAPCLVRLHEQRLFLRYHGSISLSTDPVDRLAIGVTPYKSRWRTARQFIVKQWRRNSKIRRPRARAKWELLCR